MGFNGRLAGISLQGRANWNHHQHPDEFAGRLADRTGPIADSRTHRRAIGIHRQRRFRRAGGDRGGRGGFPGRGGARGGGGGAPGASLRVQVDDVATGTTTFDVSASASTNMPLDGIYYWFNFSGANFAAGSAELVTSAPNAAPITLSFANLPTGGTRYADATVKSIRITGAGNRVVEFSFANPTHIVLQQSPGGGRGGRGGGAERREVQITITAS